MKALIMRWRAVPQIGPAGCFRFQLRRLAAVALLLAGTATIAAEAAERRIALVIGNSGYRHAGDLPSPANAARKLGATLEQLAFETRLAIDLDYYAMQMMLRDFGADAEAADIALAFFAGHGIQVAGINYLLPIDARLLRERDLIYEAVPLDRLLGEVSQARRLGVVILDASHANPLADSLRRTMGPAGARQVGTGLARVESLPANTVLAFSTDFGAVVAEDTGPPGPYADALARHLPEVGVELGLIFRKVRNSVMAMTAERQTPQILEALGDEPFYFRPGPAGGMPPAQPSELAFDARPDQTQVGEPEELVRLRQLVVQRATDLAAERASLRTERQRMIAAVEAELAARQNSFEQTRQTQAAAERQLREHRGLLEQQERKIAAERREILRLRTAQEAARRAFDQRQADHAAAVQQLETTRQAIAAEQAALAALRQGLAQAPDPNELVRLQAQLKQRERHLADESTRLEAELAERRAAFEREQEEHAAERARALLAEQSALEERGEGLRSRELTLAARESDLNKLIVALDQRRATEPPNQTRGLAQGDQPSAEAKAEYDQLVAARAELDAAIRELAALRQADDPRLASLAETERRQAKRAAALDAERAALDRDRATLQAVLNDLADLPNPDELRRTEAELERRAAELAQREAAFNARQHQAAAGQQAQLDIAPARGGVAIVTREASRPPAPARVARAADDMVYIARGPSNLRAGPGMDFPVIGSLSTGDRLKIRSRPAGKDWYQIERADGLIAYMHKSLLGTPLLQR